MLRIYIDNILLNDQPNKLNDLEFTISLDFDTRTLLKKSESVLEFVGDGYDYLYKSYIQNGYNGRHTIRIEKKSGDSWYNIWNGFLLISDIEIDLGKNSISLRVEDSSYTTLINNNRKVKTYLGYTKTKNGLDISFRAQELSIGMFNPPSNTITANRYVYPIYDVFRQLCLFISDNEVDFVSDYLTSLSDNEKITYGVTIGENIRNFSFGGVNLNLEDLLNDFGIAHNLYLQIEETSGQPILRLEPLSYYANKEVAIRCEDIKQIKRSYIQELLYSNIKVGSTAAITDVPALALENHPPFNFEENEFYLFGKNNIDREKDLSINTYIFDSNAIEDSFINGATDNDKELFLIEYHPTILKALTDTSNILGGTTQFFYNGSLTNANIIRRHPWQNGQQALLGDITEEMDTDNDRTYLTANSTLDYQFEVTDLLFEREVSDVGNHYNPLNGRYTATANGTKNIFLSLRWYMKYPLDCLENPLNSEFGGNVSFLGFCYIKSTPVIRVYNSLNVLKTEIFGDSQDRIWSDCIEQEPEREVLARTEAFFTVYLENTDYFTVSMQYERFSQWIDQGGVILKPPRPIMDSTFDPTPSTGIFTNTSGNIEITRDSNLKVLIGTNVTGQLQDEIGEELSINRWEFNSIISDQEVNDILSSPSKAILLTNAKQQININTWAKLITIKPLTNEVSFETINSIENI